MEQTIQLMIGSLLIGVLIPLIYRIWTMENRLRDKFVEKEDYKEDIKEIKKMITHLQDLVLKVFWTKGDHKNG